MLMSVYDAHGEMFEVRPDVAKRLIIQEGWSPLPPVVAADTPADAATTVTAVEVGAHAPDPVETAASAPVPL